jgi:segregation and condensation protein B
MKIVTTPMCREIVELAGVSDYIVSSDPDSTPADLAVVLWETKTALPSLKFRLNTFRQIKHSIKILADNLGTKPLKWPLGGENVSLENNFQRKKIKVKVYSKFIRDIVEDMGFTLVDKDPDFMVYPDYLRDEITHEIELAGDKAVEVPSHKNAPANPIERAKMRYNILEKRLCMKL